MKRGKSTGREERLVVFVGGDSPAAVSSSELLLLPHPRSGSPALFLLQDGGSLFELQQCTRAVGPCSLFADNAVHSDGSVYLATPFDPLFVALPFLLKARASSSSSGQGKFCKLSEIFEHAAASAQSPGPQSQESTQPSQTPPQHGGQQHQELAANLRRLVAAPGVAARIERACDVQAVLDLRIVRLSEERLVSSLCEKFAKSLEAVTSQAVLLPEATYVSQSTLDAEGKQCNTMATDTDSARRVCWELIACLLPKDAPATTKDTPAQEEQSAPPSIREMCIAKLGLTELLKEKAKRPRDAAADAQLAGQQGAAPPNKVLKTAAVQSKAAKDAAKHGGRDVKGVKSIASFFGAKK